MPRKPLEEGEVQFVSLCSLLSNTLHIIYKNGLKLQSFLFMIFSQKYFLNENHIHMANIVCEKSFFQVKIKKRCYWNCCLWPSNGHRRQFEPDPNQCYYPLMTYLTLYLFFYFFRHKETTSEPIHTNYWVIPENLFIPIGQDWGVLSQLQRMMPKSKTFKNLFIEKDWPWWRLTCSWHQKTKPPILQFTNLKCCIKAREPFKPPF